MRELIRGILSPRRGRNGFRLLAMERRWICEWFRGSMRELWSGNSHPGPPHRLRRLRRGEGENAPASAESCPVFVVGIRTMPRCAQREPADGRLEFSWDSSQTGGNELQIESPVQSAPALGGDVRGYFGILQRRTPRNLNPPNRLAKNHDRPAAGTIGEPWHRHPGPFHCREMQG